MSTVNVIPIRAGVKRPRGPSARKVIEDRLEEQRQRIFQVSAIISVVAKVLDDLGEKNDERCEQPCWWSLIAAQELLQDIASELEPGVCLGTGEAQS